MVPMATLWLVRRTRRRCMCVLANCSAGQQRVPASFLENFNIPLPPKEKQAEMANHVYELRQQVKTLQEEGKRIMESAKQEVERMIMYT